MPIISAQDARDLDSHLQLFFDANPAERSHRLRLLFTEKFDFNAATGKVSLAEAPKNVTLPSDAERIASIEGINVVYVPLEIPGTTRVRKAEAAASARMLARQLGDDMLLLISNQQTGGEVSQLHVILPTFAGSTPALRRMVIERDLPRRTVLQQLSNIYHQWQQKKDLRLALEEAFDVEAVTRAFFQQYREVFERVQGLVRGFPGTDDGREAKKLFVQTLFNRLMFIYFLSPTSALLEGSAEGVNIINLLASQWGELMTNVGDFDGHTTWGSREAGGDGEYLVRVGTENRQHVLGHISLLGYRGRIIAPMTTGGPNESALGDPIEVLLTEWARQCRKQGGLVVLPHFPNPRAEHAASIVSGDVDALEMTSWGNLYSGIDRLVMLLTGQQSIREVILFPQLREKA